MRQKGSGTHPNSLANLESFKPGQSGNPAGKPHGAPTMKVVLKSMLEQEFPEHLEGYENIKKLIHKTGSKLTLRDVLGAVAINAALNSDFRFFKEIIDREDGPISTRFEGEITTRRDTDNMTDDELLEYVESINQKRQLLGIHERTPDTTT